MKDTSNKNNNDNELLNEQQKLMIPSEDFDFDVVYNKFNNQNNDRKKPFVLVDINKLQTGINLRKYIQTQLKYNPDLDPYQLEHAIVKEFDFDFVKNNYKETVFDDNNQYVFECDTVWMYKVYDLFMLSDFGMYIPYQKEDTVQYDIRRFYLKINDKYAPIFIEKDYIIFEHKLFGLSDEVANEIACYIINNQDIIYKHIDNNTVYDNIKSLPNLIPLSLVIGDDITEAFKLEPSETNLARCLWIDSTDRTTGHAKRVKYQHNLKEHDTNNWASIIIDPKNNFPIRNNKNKDISDKLEDIIRKFVSLNYKLIIDVSVKMDSMEYSNSKDIKKYFLDNCIKVDKKGNVINVNKITEPDIYKTEYFNNGKYCIVINSESKLYNVIDTTTHEYMFDDWFIYISVVPPMKMITLYKDDLQYNVDFDLKKIK